MRARDTLADAMSETQLQGAVIDMARSIGWLVHHCRPARTNSGRWSTPIEGTAGFPDLILVHPERGIVFAELKAERKKPTAEQRQWLDDVARLRVAVAKSYCWRPSDWLAGRVEAVLQHGPQGAFRMPWWELDERFHPRVPA